MQNTPNGKISTIVQNARRQLSLAMEQAISQEQFGDMLTEGLSNMPLSRTSVSAWETGKYEPDSDLLWAMVVRHYGTSDWRLSFALACLRTKLPDIFDAGIVEIEIPTAG